MAMNIGVRASSMQTTETLLLDNYSTNLVMAYSLRKLRGGYSGYCIRVKRSSDSTTQDIGFVDNVLDVASMESFVGSGTGYVVRWYDQSGNGYDLDTVDSDATSPTIRASSTTEVDAQGNPRIKFVSSAMQRIYRNANLNISVTVAAGGANSCILVCNVTSDGTDQQTPLSQGNNTINPRFLLHVPLTTRIYYDHGNNSTLRFDVANPSDLFTLDTNIFGFRAKSTTTTVETIRQNGTELGTSTFSGSYTNTAKRFSLGANWGGGSYNSPFNGHIQEVIVWNADVGSTELAAIESDCSTFYTT